jgi:hypothetical protein
VGSGSECALPLLGIDEPALRFLAVFHRDRVQEVAHPLRLTLDWR